MHSMKRPTWRNETSQWINQTQYIIWATEPKSQWM